MISDARSRSDSAYGGSVRGSSVASTPVATSVPIVISSPRNDNGKSSGRGSHSSSVASLDDQDSSGYARIEDIDNMKENFQKRYFIVILLLLSVEKEVRTAVFPSVSFNGSDFPFYVSI